MLDFGSMYRLYVGFWIIFAIIIWKKLLNFFQILNNSFFISYDQFCKNKLNRCIKILRVKISYHRI